MTTGRLLTKLFALILLVPNSFAVVKVPGLQTGCRYYYAREGDINLGQVVNAHESNGEGGCSDAVSEGGIFFAQTMVYAINQINDNDRVLPNITLGFSIMDTCDSTKNALGRSMYFLPYDDDNDNSNNAGNSTDNHQCLPGSETTKQRSFDVVGLVGPEFSAPCVMIANVFSLFQIPVLGTLCTSDELGDRSRFSYFLRLVSPDSIQAEAMMDLIVHFNWTYISLVYSEGPYGENGGKHIEKQAKRRGACVSYSVMLPSDASGKDYDEAVQGLIRHKNAKAVALFIQPPHPEPFFEAIERAGALGMFIFVSSDGLMDQDHGYRQNGVFTIFHKLDTAVPAIEYFKTITPENHPDNPWLPLVWEQRFDCSFQGTGNQSCDAVKNQTLENPNVPFWAGKVIDGVRTYSYALHNMIQDRCPNAANDKSVLSDCIDTLLLLDYMKNVTFDDGYGGPVEFTERGDMSGQYIFNQFDSSKANPYSYVGLWRPGNLSLDGGINWELYNRTATPETDNIGDEEIPESVCSKPCPPKHYYIYKELPCCWECKTCRDNEKVVNASKCEVCEENTWPDEETATYCETIEPTYLKWTQPISLGITLLGCVGLIFVLGTAALYVRNSDTKLIKATSRELMGILLFGIFLAYVSVFTFVARPTTWSCFSSRIGFNLSVSFIYAPLLVKTNRIYRIFAAGKKGNKRPKYIGSTAQVVITLTLILIQVSTITVELLLFDIFTNAQSWQ